MRSILLLALTTAVACENTDGDTAQTDEETTTESARQAPDSLENLLEEDLAGGMPKHVDGLVFFENFDEEDSDPNEWGAAPLTSGTYDATIDWVESNECSPIKPGDEFGGKLMVDEDGNSVLNGGLLESRGDQLRYNRIIDMPYQRTDDCFAVEITKGTGTVDDAMSMTMDFHITMALEGSDCPIVETCTDAYSASFEHQMIDLDTPIGPGTDLVIKPDLGDLLHR